MKLLLTGSAVALLSFTALAQEPQAGAGSPFDALDADKNASISVAEGQAHPVVSQNFGTADKNGDGSLTREEFNAAFTTTRPAQPQPERPPAPQP
jgi:hypothetical protein